MEANKNLYRSSEMSKVLLSSTPKATRPGNFKRITHHLYLEVLLLFYILLSSCISVVEQTDVLSSKSVCPVCLLIHCLFISCVLLSVYLTVC